jgi:muramoyltetrapeptide carboxypeptidase LdcA involved in peptidoglycan recycling
MRYPEFLKENGTIGFVAPSFGCATEPYKSAFENALRRFQAMGYGVDLGPNCFLEQGIGISNAPSACGAELNEAYLSEENDVLISCGGGELMCEVVPYMDFARIKEAKPKWYMGFSDNTNYTFLSATICDTAAIYGPCAAAFGMEPWDESIADAFALLSGKVNRVHGYAKWEKESLKDETHPYVPYNLTEPTQIRGFIPKNGALIPQTEVQPISFSGRLIGGCMDCLVNLLGTEFDHVKEFNERYSDTRKIWFLESCDLNIMSIRRAIWQMKHAGWFENVSAFLIGRPLCFGSEMFGIDQYRAVTDLLAEYEVPVIMDLDIGHLPPMMPVVCGATAEVAVDGNHIDIGYTWS